MSNYVISPERAREILNQARFVLPAEKQAEAAQALDETARWLLYQWTENTRARSRARKPLDLKRRALLREKIGVRSRGRERKKLGAKNRRMLVGSLLGFWLNYSQLDRPEARRHMPSVTAHWRGGFSGPWLALVQGFCAAVAEHLAARVEKPLGLRALAIRELRALAKSSEHARRAWHSFRLSLRPIWPPGLSFGQQAFVPK